MRAAAAHLRLGIQPPRPHPEECALGEKRSSGVSWGMALSCQALCSGLNKRPVSRLAYALGSALGCAGVSGRCLRTAAFFSYAMQTAKELNVVVVFDLDGTLVDSSRVLLHAHDVAWSTLGLPRPSDAAILELVGLPLRDTMQTLAPDQDPEPLCALYSQAYAAAATEHERLFDGAKALLARPFRAAVATGKSQRGAERVVKQHGLERRFEAVYGGDAVARPKPYPDMLHAIMETTQCEELVMVGDTTYDLEMAQAAGVFAIGVSWGHHAVERLSPWAPVVHSMAELQERLGV